MRDKQPPLMGTEPAGVSDAAASIVIVSSCDQYYFPLLKGLFLSLLESKLLDARFQLAFINMGCDADSLEWLHVNKIRVAAFDPLIMGELADQRFGYQRAQICRPFLPELFPQADVLVWMDCDMWVQDVAGIKEIVLGAARNRELFFVSSETHPGYVADDFTYRGRIKELFDYYRPIYGYRTAYRQSNLPTFNSGLFTASRHHPVWQEWRAQIVDIYLQRYGKLSEKVRHFAEQIALNVMLRRVGGVSEIDPGYNYVSLWKPPFRDTDNVVRLPFAPYCPVGVIHLAGGWRNFGQLYLARDLLYESGNYLADYEREALSVMPASDAFR